MTFTQFLFNRYRHGKWTWYNAIIAYFFGLCCLVAGIVSGVWYFSVPFWLVFMGVIIRGHWKNYNGQQG